MLNKHFWRWLLRSRTAWAHPPLHPSPNDRTCVWTRTPNLWNRNQGAVAEFCGVLCLFSSRLATQPSNSPTAAYRSNSDSNRLRDSRRPTPTQSERRKTIGGSLTYLIFPISAPLFAIASYIASRGSSWELPTAPPKTEPPLSSVTPVCCNQFVRTQSSCEL